MTNKGYFDEKLLLSWAQRRLFRGRIAKEIDNCVEVVVTLGNSGLGIGMKALH